MKGKYVLLSYVMGLLSPLLGNAYVFLVVVSMVSYSLLILSLPLFSLLQGIAVPIGGVSVLKIVGLVLLSRFLLYDIHTKKIPLNLGSLKWVLIAWITYIPISYIMLSNMGTSSLSGVAPKLALFIFMGVLYVYLDMNLKYTLNIISETRTLIPYGVIITLVISVFVYFGNPGDITLGYARLKIADGDPNDLAVHIGAFFPFCVWLAESENSIEKFLGFVAIISSISIISMTVSRGGIIAALSSLLIYFIYTNKKFLKKGLLLAAAFAMALYLSKYFYSNLYEVLRYRLLLEDGSIPKRINLYLDAWNAFTERPIFGWGMESEVQRIITGDQSIHSALLAVMAQGGILGALLYVLPFSYIFLKTALSPVIRNKETCVFVSATFGFFIGAMFLSWTFKEVVWIFLVFSYFLVDNIRNVRSMSSK